MRCECKRVRAFGIIKIFIFDVSVGKGQVGALERIIVLAAFIAVLVFASALEASNVTLKISSDPSTLSQKGDESFRDDSNDKDSSFGNEELAGEDVVKKGSFSDDSIDKNTGNAENLIFPPKSPLPPMTDSERNQKYPVVKDALEMTLETLIPTKELRNVRVLKTMARIPRAEFVPKDYREYAYQDAAIPIGESQTISPPFIVAYMTETLDPQPTDRVLEIGTGSGYQAAVLSCLVSEVYTIEIVKSLGRRAADVLKKLEYNNVFVRLGDGYNGWAEAAPFDKIIVTCSPENIPQPLIDQLKEGGKMLIPIGERYLQYFVLCEKKNGELLRTTLTPASFVPMTGKAETLRKDIPDPIAPSLIGGNFEEINPTPGEVAPTATWKTDSMIQNGDKEDWNDEKLSVDELSIKLPSRRPSPVGWFSTRNTYVDERDDAYEGKRVCVCDNASVKENQNKKDRNEERFKAATLPENRRSLTLTETAMRTRQRAEETVCHLRQNFAIDGSNVKKITLSGAYRVKQLNSNVDSRPTVTLVKLFFFDRERKPIRKGGEIIVLSAESFPCSWTEFSQVIPVPPRATEASLQVGILDGVGIVEFDDFRVENKNAKSSKSSGK